MRGVGVRTVEVTGDRSGGDRMGVTEVRVTGWG